jgi:hypothetical protein
MHKFVLCILFNCFITFGFAQTTYVIKKINENITVDGDISDPVWQNAQKLENFQQYFPTDTVLAVGQSEIQMVYDDNFLYISLKCYSSGNNWVVNSLKRDYRGGGIDNMTFVFDAFKDKTNAYFFGINAEGVRREGVISNGGTDFRDFDESWDNKWIGDAKKFDKFYTAELKIPFSSMRYNEGSELWNFGAYRFDAQCNEWSTLTGVPRNLPMTNLGFNMDIRWEEPLEASTSKVSLIPFATTGWSKNYEEGEEGKLIYDVGGDAKIAITPSINLDLTVNPDFSQVEVDQQITDLSRFEIFFPERRQFFLENADLFGDFGTNSINPFFSRRIGIAENNDGDIVQNRIYAGARLSGNVNQNLRIGLLNMQTASDKDNGIHATNFSVLALQRRIWSRSNISFIAVNKQLLNVEQLQDAEFIEESNRVFGVDFNFADASNVWTGKTFVHGSSTPGTDGVPLTHGAELNYNTLNWDISYSHEYVSEDYDAQVGFVRRNNYIRFNPSISREFYPEGGVFNNIGIGSDVDFFFRPGFGKTDHEITFGVGGTTNDNGRFSFGFSHNYVYLFDEFDPTGTDSETLKADTEYNYIAFGGQFSTDRRKPVSFFVSPYIGQYFNGWRYGSRGRVTFVSKPKASIAIDVNYNYFDMPHLDEAKQTFLLGPRIDYTFSKELFFTTFIQYNTQSQNTNINARLQWRFAPVSDFFLVFTDNYFSGDDPSDRFSFNIQNRAIVAKVTYWLNT